MSSRNDGNVKTFNVKKFSAEKLFHAHFVNYVLSIDNKKGKTNNNRVINLPFRQEITPLLSMEMETKN